MISQPQTPEAALREALERCATVLADIYNNGTVDHMQVRLAFNHAVYVLKETK